MTVVRGPSIGFDRHTGELLIGWPHVVQSLEVLWTTFLGERTIREDVGNPGTKLLGENMTAANILRFWQIIKIVTDMREPRFSIVQVSQIRTTPEALRTGSIGFLVNGLYRPRIHLGDPTPESRRSVRIDTASRTIGVQSA